MFWWLSNLIAKLVLSHTCNCPLRLDNRFPSYVVQTGLLILLPETYSSFILPSLSTWRLSSSNSAHNPWNLLWYLSPFLSLPQPFQFISKSWNRSRLWPLLPTPTITIFELSLHGHFPLLLKQQPSNGPPSSFHPGRPAFSSQHRYQSLPFPFLRACHTPCSESSSGFSFSLW